MRRIQGVQIQTGGALTPLQNQGDIRGIQGLPVLLGPLPHVPGKETASSPISHLQETLSTLVLLPAPPLACGGSGPGDLQRHIVEVNVETEREAGAGGLPRPAEHGVGVGGWTAASTYLSGIILRKLGAHI